MSDRASETDLRHMRHALSLAARGLGQVAPNPAVGCVIVKEGRVVGRGWTQRGGRPHAETVALIQAGDAASGATAYVTLEPCAHHGQTPPCAEALVKAGIARVVCAIEDPDPRVSGRGFEILRDAGLFIITSVMEKQARDLNEGFFQNRSANRPRVTLKIAQSLDGRIAAANGESKWITGEDARRFGHLLRAKHDAILVGIETALADDPDLTCRLPGLEDRSPVRVVLDSMLRLPVSSKLAKTAKQVPVIVYTLSEPRADLVALGVEIVQVAEAGGHPSITAVLGDLAARGITRLLVEGGAGMHAAFLDAGAADRLEVFHAPALLGGVGRPAVSALSAAGLGMAPRFERLTLRQLGDDVLETLAAKA